jgi:endonuclease YncB( thermonuclease family)
LSEKQWVGAIVLGLIAPSAIGSVMGSGDEEKAQAKTVAPQDGGPVGGKLRGHLDRDSLTASVPSAAGTPATVVASIYDGDTLTLTNGQRVRLLQIDTPELGSGECYSRAARTALVQRVPIGSSVTLEVDPRLDRVDRYGRLLRYVHRGTMNVNIGLVRAGAAAPYFYGGDKGRYAARLLSEAQSAKAAKHGLWKACPGTKLDPYQAVDTGTSGPPTTRPPASGNCDPNYRGACVPNVPYDLDCADIDGPVYVVGRDGESRGTRYPGVLG